MAKDKSNRRFWERYAKVYTRFMKAKEPAYKIICDEIAEYITNKSDVLELACGSGQITFNLADGAKSWTATDFSENMILEAKKRSQNPRIKFEWQDATNLTYEDETFDVVVIANALHIMPDPDRALGEIQRVLKPEGIMYAPTFVYEKDYSKFILWVLKRLGFQTFHKWTAVELAEYIGAYGFVELKSRVIPGSPLPTCMMIGRKIK